MKHSAATAIVCFTGNSGLTDYSVSLARALGNLTKVVLVTGSAIAPEYRALGFEIITLFRKSRFYPIDFVRFIAWSLRERPAVISFQAHLKVPVLEGLFVALLRRYGIHCVLTVHDVLPHYPHWWSKLEFGWFYRRFDRLVVHSKSAQVAVGSLGVVNPVLVVPHGVYDLFRRAEPTKAKARELIGLAVNDAFTVLFFGHLELRKGLVPALKAALALPPDENIQFVFAGKNDIQTQSWEASRLLDKSRASPNIWIHDQRIPFASVENYFCAADLVLLPYLEGTTSGVLKLALAFGIPVVATNVGDFPEQMPSGGGILISADGDLVQSLAGAIKRIRLEPQKYASAMKAAAENCDWKDIAHSYYRFLLADSGDSLA